MNRIGAILIGGLLGAGAAFLLAPNSGEDTRRRLRERSLDWQNDAKDRLATGRMRATELIRSTQEKTTDMLEKGAQEIPEALQRSRRAVDDAAAKAQRKVDEMQRGGENTADRSRDEDRYY